MKRGLALFLAALLTALALTACGGGDKSGGGSSNTSMPMDSAAGSKAEYQEAWGFNADMPAESPQTAEEEDRLADAKMVYTASIEAETMDFDGCCADFEALVEGMGGYLEYASTDSYGDGRRSGDYTARIPAAKFNAFIKNVGDIGHVVSKSRNAENISERYYDTESRLVTQRTKLERLQTLLAKAELMEDIIVLESAIAETELEIEQLTGSLRHYDALVDYATVDVHLREVIRLSTVEESPPTFADRLGGAFTGGLQSFGDFLQELAIFLAYNWIWILVLAAILLVVVKVSRRKQIRRTELPRQPREGGFFKRKKDGPKNPDDKQP